MARVLRPLLSAVGLWALCLAVVVQAEGGANAGSPLLERVKANPALARRMCARFRQLNAQGISATSPRSIAIVAQEHGLSAIDAEVLTTYVMGMHCSDVR